MSQPLVALLRHIRLRARRLVWTHGLCLFAAVLLGGTFVAGLLDWAIHVDDPGTRLILSAGIAIGALWTTWRYLVTPLLVSLSDLNVARYIERRYPALADSLTSTVDFLEHNTDTRTGSPELQRHVIERTLEQLARVDVNDVIETRAVRRGVTASLIIALVVACIAGWNHADAATAVSRLVFPFSAGPWPRKTELVFLDGKAVPLADEESSPLRMVQGDTLKLYVENRKGRLPDDLACLYRIDRPPAVEAPFSRTTLRDDKGQLHEVGVLEIVLTKGPLEFRAVGGDDREMPWRSLDVVPAPVVESMQAVVTPPAYAHRPAERMPAGAGHVRGLVGAKVEIEAKANKRLSAATLCIQGAEPVPVKPAGDLRSLKASFVIREAGSSNYWFQLKDSEGFSHTQPAHFDIHGIADLVPDLYIDKPAADVSATTGAVVPIRVVAKDDLGLKELSLHFKLVSSAEGAPQSIVLFAAKPPGVEQQAVEYNWSLKELKLSEGARVEFHAEATDYCDVGPPHRAESLVRTLTIISVEEKRAELAARQGALLDELERIAQLETQTHGQTEELILQLEKAGALQSGDVDLLKRIELDQRQIAARLHNPAEGVESEAQNILGELQNNQIDDAETRARLEQIGGELRVLREDHMPRIDRALTQVRKTTEQSTAASKSALPEPAAKKTPPSPDVNKKPQPQQPNSPAGKPQKGGQLTALAEVGRQQALVRDSLAAMIDQLARWKNRSDLAGEASDLAGRQETLNRETADVARRTLTKRPADLLPQEKADLARLAERQRNQADRLDGFRDKLNQALESLRDAGSAAADTLHDARDHLTERGTASRMREAAAQLDENRIGMAAGRQQESLNDLQELKNLLEYRAAGDTEELVKKLTQSERELEKISQRQQDLLHKSRDLAGKTSADRDEKLLDTLAREQQALQEEDAGLARRLRRLQARQAGNSARRAASRMQAARERLDQDDPANAGDEQQESLNDLEQARRELAEARRQAQEQLSREALESVAADLAAMVARQQSVIEETRRLDDAQKTRGNWTRPLLKSLSQLAEAQAGLQSETQRLAKKLSATEVLAMALSNAEQSMRQAVARLQDRHVDEATVHLEQSARQRFVDLVDAFKKDAAAPKQGGQPGAAEPGDGAAGDTQVFPPMVQLKILKSLQVDLNRRTRELETQRPATGEWTAAQQELLKSIAVEQGKLADVLQALIPTAAAEPGTDNNDENKESTP